MRTTKASGSVAAVDRTLRTFAPGSSHELTRIEALRRLALAAENCDPSASEHTERVARIAGLLAERLGWPASRVSVIRQAAPLHDIGKLTISASVLLKPGRLTAPEFEQVKRHAAAGAAMLAGAHSEVLRLAREIALTHHEWWDGSGYPAGLKANAIPQSGRIVALADVFDALMHVRPYKPAWRLARAVKEIQRLRGRQFDPAVVDAFATIDPGEVRLE